MSVPEAAIEAAAETLDAIGSVGPNMTPRYVAQLAIQAAMPAIREAIAQEIEKAALRPAAYQRAFADAALIVRGGIA